LEEGLTEFGATLIFMHDGSRLTLSRTSVGSLNAVGDIGIDLPKVTLKVANGDALAERDVQPYIDNILSEEVSDFFLFDGEMLHSFDKRLKEDRDSTRQFVREQVEKALGLPFLT